MKKVLIIGAAGAVLVAGVVTGVVLKIKSKKNTNNVAAEAKAEVASSSEEVDETIKE
jgi:hypothetical protein